MRFGLDSLVLRNHLSLGLFRLGKDKFLYAIIETVPLYKKSGITFHCVIVSFDICHVGESSYHYWRLDEANGLFVVLE